MPDRVRRAIRGVLTDIDDTLTTDGKLTADAYAALERLRAAGKLVIPVTGRPAGWCDHIARMWPVDAVVGENGAFYMQFDERRRRLVRRFVSSDAEREAQRTKLAAIGAQILQAVPGSALASDQHYRETDLAIDYCEDVPPLPRADVDRIVALMQGAGMTAKESFETTVVAENQGGEPGARKLGAVVVAVTENELPQNGLKVNLLDDKNQVVQQATTGGGKAVFQDVPPGKYTVTSSKPSTRREGRASAVVIEGKTTQVAIKLLLR